MIDYLAQVHELNVAYNSGQITLAEWTDRVGPILDAYEAERYADRPRSDTYDKPYPMGMTGKAGGDVCACGAPRRNHYRWLGANGISDHNFVLGAMA